MCIESRTEFEYIKVEFLYLFGEIPIAVENLFRISMIRVYAHRLYMTEVKGRSGEIRFLFKPDANIRPEGIPVLLKKFDRLSFNPKGTPCFLFRYKKYDVVERDAQMLLEHTETLLAAMEKELAAQPSQPLG